MLSAHDIEEVSPIIDFIKENNNFLLTTHLNADGDAIGAVLACSMLLDSMSKNYKIILHDSVTDPKYSYLQNWDKICPFEQIGDNTDLNIDSVLIFDAPGLHRLGDVENLITQEHKIVKIDHHPAEDAFSKIDWVDTSKSSASAMIYEIVRQSNIAFDKHIFEAIYTGIIYDTGRLSFSNTQPRDLEICAECIRKGVRPSVITNNLFFSLKVKPLQVIGKGLQSIKQHLDGKVTTITVFNDQLEGVEQSEIEELANYSVSLKGSEVGVYIREIKPGFFKLSLRSKEYVNVSEVAKVFNGGGHVRASGCRFDGPYEDLIPKMLKEIQKQL